ncbi:MAG: hypothetical protein QOH21_1055 [Acidobacteriota bacterium]|jgi:hypothetical protein|nr:hypothetical protein [Acidobacteriota bacterium]
MKSTQLVWLHLSLALTTLTGAVFAWMKYLMTSDDEFAVINHPMQPHMLAAHVVVAPVLLFILGWTFSNHMLPKYRSGNPKHRRSGLSAMFLIAPMTLSAYLLQIATNEGVRQAMTWAHWGTSAVFVGVYVVHVILGVRRG